MSAASSTTGMLCFLFERALRQHIWRNATTQVVYQVAALIAEAHRIVKAAWAAVEKIHAFYIILISAMVPHDAV